MECAILPLVNANVLLVQPKKWWVCHERDHVCCNYPYSDLNPLYPSVVHFHGLLV